MHSYCVVACFLQVVHGPLEHDPDLCDMLYAAHGAFVLFDAPNKQHHDGWRSFGRKFSAYNAFEDQLKKHLPTILKNLGRIEYQTGFPRVLHPREVFDAKKKKGKAVMPTDAPPAKVPRAEHIDLSGSEPVTNSVTQQAGPCSSTIATHVQTTRTRGDRHLKEALALLLNCGPKEQLVHDTLLSGIRSGVIEEKDIDFMTSVKLLPCHAPSIHRILDAGLVKEEGAAIAIKQIVAKLGGKRSSVGEILGCEDDSDPAGCVAGGSNQQRRRALVLSDDSDMS